MIINEPRHTESPNPTAHRSKMSVIYIYICIYIYIYVYILYIYIYIYIHILYIHMLKTHQLTNLGLRGYSFYEEGIFLTMCTCKTINKSLFSIICHVLLHFLFLFYTVSIMKLILYFTCNFIMETLKVH